jgi:hypothetical protein
MQRILTEAKRDFITLTKDGSNIVLTNPRTNAQTILPRDASPNEIREARLGLQEQADTDSLLNQRAGIVMDKLAGAKPAEVDSDPEPRRLAEGVGSPNSPYRLRQEKLWAEWKKRDDERKARARELETQDRLVEKLSEAIKPKPAEPEPTPHIPYSAERSAAVDSYISALKSKDSAAIDAAKAELGKFQAEGSSNGQ